VPKSVRNFWVETEVDGLARTMASGPRNKKGGFTTKVLVREEGSISDSYLMIEGKADDEGNLLLTVKMHRKDSVTKMQLVTNRDSPLAAPEPSIKRLDAFWREVREDV